TAARAAPATRPPRRPPPRPTDDSIPPPTRPPVRVAAGCPYVAAPATNARTAERRPGVADSLRQALADPAVGQIRLSPRHSLLPWGAGAFLCPDQRKGRGSAVCGSCHGVGAARSPTGPLRRSALSRLATRPVNGSRATRSPVPPAYTSRLPFDPCRAARVSAFTHP